MMIMVMMVMVVMMVVNEFLFSLPLSSGTLSMVTSSFVEFKTFYYIVAQ